MSPPPISCPPTIQIYLLFYGILWSLTIWLTVSIWRSVFVPLRQRTIWSWCGRLIYPWYWRFRFLINLFLIADLASWSIVLSTGFHQSRLNNSSNVCIWFVFIKRCLMYIRCRTFVVHVIWKMIFNAVNIFGWNLHSEVRRANLPDRRSRHFADSCLHVVQVSYK